MKQAIVDLAQHNWQAEIGNKEGDRQWAARFRGERVEDGNAMGMSIEVAGKSVDLEFHEVLDLVGYALMAIFLSQDLPNEAVPAPLQGNMQASGMWAHLQGANILPLLVRRAIPEIPVGDMKFTVDFGYTPNVSSGNIVALNGKKNDTWDGSFRPVLRLHPAQQPEFKPKEMEPA